MTVEELLAELKNIVASLTASGFTTIDSGMAERLDKFAVAAGKAGMKEGKRLVKNLSKTMKAIQKGKSKAESGSVRLTAIDFYVKKHTPRGIVEDL